MRIKMINRLTGGDMWVADNRVDEYKAAGHKLAAATQPQPKAKKVEEPKEEPKVEEEPKEEAKPKKTTAKPKRTTKGTTK